MACSAVKLQLPGCRSVSCIQCKPSFRERLEELAKEHEDVLAEVEFLRNEAQFFDRRADRAPARPTLLCSSPCRRQKHISDQLLGCGDRPGRLQAESVRIPQLPTPEASHEALTPAVTLSISRTENVQQSPTLLSSRSRSSNSLGTTVIPRWFAPSGGQKSLRTTKNFASLRLDTSSFSHRPCNVFNFGVLDPYGRSRLSWDLLWCVGLIYDIWINCFTLFFLQRQSLPQALEAINLVVVVFFFADIFINFNTGYTQGCHIVRSRRLIAIKYLRFWFWIDLVASVPVEYLIDDRSSFFATLRAAKIPKAAHLLKLLKVLRIVKVLVNRRRYVKSAGAAQRLKLRNRATCLEQLVYRLERPLGYLSRIIQGFLILVVLSHFHGCAWESLHPEWSLTQDVDLAFQSYWEAVSWAYMALTSAEFGPAQGSGALLLDALIATERLVLGCMMIIWGVFKALTFKEEDAGVEMMQDNALRYLEKRSVSIDTQSQVIYSVNETSSKVKELRSFERMLASHNLPPELTRCVREELWSDHLMSLKLIYTVNCWCDGFVTELAQLVSEEIFASKVIVCVEGDIATSAFYVLTGQLGVRNSTRPRVEIAPFTPGMWLGERTLVNNNLKRSGTIFTTCQSTVMSVPAQGFRALLVRLELASRFEAFCRENLWKGLCGRCGELGDHFADDCPLVTNKFDAMCPTKSTGASREIPLFLRMQNLEHLESVVQRLEVESIHDVDVERLREMAFRDGIELTEDEAKLFTEASVREFLDQMASNVQSMMHHHYIFLSHYKLEAGTEASLIRAELERLLEGDKSQAAESTQHPVFVDSEDLDDLADLQRHVRESRNIVLLLTKGVLTRPWCLIELATAAQAGVPVHLLKVSKRGSDFEYPDESFYQSMQAERILDEAAQASVIKAGFDLTHIVRVLRQVFNKIAVPYSPHGQAAIRKAELQALLKLCHK